MIIRGHGALWDPERHKVVGRFVNGRLETTDENVIMLARWAGFTTDDAEPQAPPAEPAVDHLTALSKSELLELAEERGVEVRKSWKVDEVRAALREAEE